MSPASERDIAEQRVLDARAAAAALRAQFLCPAHPPGRARRISVAEMWEGFLRTAIPHSAPAEQITEMRKAFYSGAWSLFQVLTGVGLDEGQEATDTDLAYMDRLNGELQAFIAEKHV
jgi:hypothetical protein